MGRPWQCDQSGKASARAIQKDTVDSTNVTLRGVFRLEVATFLIDELEQNRYVRQAVFIGHERAWRSFGPRAC